MKKTWIKIIIVSFVLLVVEAVGSLIFLKPYITKYQLFDTIKNGQWKNTQECYAKLSDSGKDYVRDNLDAYAAWLCEKYVSGEYTYNQMVASLDAINSIDDTGEIYNRYILKVSENELRASIQRYYDADVARDNNRLYEVKNTISALMLRLDSDTRESIMVSLLTEEYYDYLDEKISAEELKGHAEIIVGISYYQAYETAYLILNNVDFVSSYRDAYNTAVALSDGSDYFGAMAIIDRVLIDPNDRIYAEKFHKLRDNCYTLGKLYYENLLDEYIAAGETDKAVELMAQLEEVYGDDFDMGTAQEALATDWQLAYVTFLNDWEKLLEGCVEETSVGAYVLGSEKEKVWPDSIFLYDVNGNGSPEMFLFNSERLGDDYVPCFMFTTEGSSYLYLGYINLIALCDDSNLITFPNAFGREAGDEYALTAYDGSSIGSTTYCQHIGDTYYVNGSECTDAEFLSEKSDIMAHQSVNTIHYLGYSSLDEAKRLVLTYK